MGPTVGHISPKTFYNTLRHEVTDGRARVEERLLGGNVTHFYFTMKEDLAFVYSMYLGVGSTRSTMYLLSEEKLNAVSSPRYEK